MQMLLGGPTDSRRVADEVARASEVTMHVRGTEISLEGNADDTALVERCLREMYELATRGRAIKPADVGRAIEVMRAIKNALDPKNILNPGKMLPEVKSAD